MPFHRVRSDVSALSRSSSHSHRLSLTTDYARLGVEPMAVHSSQVMFNPNGAKRGYWDLLVLVSIIYTLLSLPLRIAFHCHLRFVELVVDIIFLVDLALNFETGYSFRGSLEMDRKKVRTRYLRTWFLVDLLSSIPIGILLAVLDRIFNHTSHEAKITEAAFRMAPGLKVLRAPRLFRYLGRWRDLIPVSSGVLRSLVLVFWAIMFSHWDACLLFLIPELEGYPDDSWVVVSGLLSEKPFTQYTNCLIVSICHMSGQGAETLMFKPTTDSEMWATILSIFVGATFYALILGQCSSIIQRVDRIWETQQSRVDEWGKFCRIHNIPKDLTKTGFKTLAAKPIRRHAEDLEVLSQLKPGLRTKVATCLKLSFLRNSPVFTGCRPQFLDTLATCLRQHTYTERERIAGIGQDVRSMYFIAQGEVEAADERSVLHAMLRPGETFGDECILLHMERMLRDGTLHTFFDMFAREEPDEDGPSLSSSRVWSPRETPPANDSSPPVWAFHVYSAEEGTICYMLPRQAFVDACGGVPRREELHLSRRSLVINRQPPTAVDTFRFASALPTPPGS